MLHIQIGLYLLFYPVNLSTFRFIFISSKSDIIEGNDDLKNRIEIIELTESDQANNDYTIDYLLSKTEKEEQSEYTN